MSSRSIEMDLLLIEQLQNCLRPQTTIPSVIWTEGATERVGRHSGLQLVSSANALNRQPPPQQPKSE